MYVNLAHGSLPLQVGTESVETSFSQDACPSLTAPVRKLGLQTTSSLGWQSFDLVALVSPMHLKEYDPRTEEAATQQCQSGPQP